MGYQQLGKLNSRGEVMVTPVGSNRLLLGNDEYD